jgi:hypothetical protein
MAFLGRQMKVLLLTTATILGVSAIFLPLVTNAPARPDTGGKCSRRFTRAGRHVLRHSNMAARPVLG